VWLCLEYEGRKERKEKKQVKENEKFLPRGVFFSLRGGIGKGSGQGGKYPSRGMGSSFSFLFSYYASAIRLALVFPSLFWCLLSSLGR
jgi:hypothetical protein